MHSRLRAALLAVVVAAVTGACAGGASRLLAPDYEYEEDLTLSMDGSATVIVNASMPVLDALKGLSLRTDLAARSDALRDEVRAAYESPYSHVGRVSTWVRRGRRFVGIHITVPDIRTLPKAPLFSWAKYELDAAGEVVTFRQTLKQTPSKPSIGLPAWRGDEIVAFRLHLPARIRFQNSRYLDRDESRPTSRGNIITWEQRLADRLEAKPIAYGEDKTPDVMEARMDRESILFRTLWLFGIAFAAALLVLGGLIWLTMRRGRDEPQDTPAVH